MIILNYCNLIATSRHRAETSSRGRGRAGAEAGSGVAAGRQAVLHQAFCGHNVCPRRGSLSSPGVGSGSGPQEPRSSGSLLARGVWGHWSYAWALCWLPGMARAPWPRGRGQGRQLGCVGPDPEQADIKRRCCRCCLRVCAPDSHNCDFAPLPAPLVFSRWQSEPSGACRGELITVVR